MLAKNYNNISDELIDKTKLSRLNFSILALRYLEKRVSCFIELATKNKDKEENEDDQKPSIFDLEEKILKKCYKKKK